VVSVLDGWDALTVNRVTFVDLFDRVSDLDIDVKIKVFAKQTRSTAQLFDITPTTACSLHIGKLDPTTDEI
jgi:hypothetical protein